MPVEVTPNYEYSTTMPVSLPRTLKMQNIGLKYSTGSQMLLLCAEAAAPVEAGRAIARKVTRLAT
jgi:hypothetical protein